MTKVKFFSCKDTAGDISDLINDFIKDKIVLDIKFDNFWLPTQMCGPAILSSVAYSRVLVIYREVEVKSDHI